MFFLMEMSVGSAEGEQKFIDAVYRVTAIDRDKIIEPLPFMYYFPSTSFIGARLFSRAVKDSNGAAVQVTAKTDHCII